MKKIKNQPSSRAQVEGKAKTKIEEAAVGGNQIFYILSLIFNFERERAGFTLLETFISIAILVFLTTVIASGLAGFREASSMDQAVDETLELLRDARSRTLGSEGASPYGIHFAPTSVTLFPGGVWQANNPANVVVALPSLVQISSIVLSTTTASVVFERLSGESAATGTVSFTAARSGKTTRIQILQSGLFLKL